MTTTDSDIQFANGHTLLIVQFSKNEETRFYLDSMTPHGCMEQLCRIYENFLLNKLGVINGGDEEINGVAPKKNVEYQLEDALRFVD